MQFMNADVMVETTLKKITGEHTAMAGTLVQATFLLPYRVIIPVPVDNHHNIRYI